MSFSRSQNSSATSKFRMISFSFPSLNQDTLPPSFLQPLVDDFQFPSAMSITPPRKKARTISFGDSKFSDLTLKFGDQERDVHKVILSKRSGWFSTALTSSSSVCDIVLGAANADDHKESQAKTITLVDDDPIILHAMLDFYYTGDFEAVCTKHCESFREKAAFRVLQKSARSTARDGC